MGLGGRTQDTLAEIYTVANVGVFPSFKEPFGLVFVECMACKTPVIGANSGGPKDFVSKAVGELVPEPPETTDLSTVPLGVGTLGKSLAEAISRALDENWKEKKGPACLQLALDKFTVKTQVTNMLKDKDALGYEFEEIPKELSTSAAKVLARIEALQAAEGSGVLNKTETEALLLKLFDV